MIGLPVRTFVCALLLLSLSACSGHSASAPASAAPSEKAASASEAPSGIDWRTGSVDEALAEASRRGRPVLLYWGAKWCPPCNHLKATLFRDPAFIALTRRFVAVYLDGDSQGAQRWGDHFAISGYPTLITLAPDGTERLRLDGGMDLSRFPAVLKAASRQEQPVAVLRDQALAGKLPVDDDGWQLLEAHDWLMEPDVDPATQLTRLNGLAAVAPNLAQRERFGVLAACLQVMNKMPLSAAEQGDLRDLLGRVLQDPVAVSRNLGELQYLGVDMLEVAAAGQLLRGELAKVLRAAADDDTLSPYRQLESGFGLIQLAGKPVSTNLQAEWRERVHKALSAAANPHERIALVNSGYQILDHLGLGDEAEALLKAELKQTASPFYFMSDLAELAESRGDSKTALEWLHRAWQRAEGPATRLQWGTSYLQGMLRMSPDDEAGIQALSQQLADEVVATPDAWFQRSRVRLQRVGKSMSEWANNPPRKVLLQAFQEHLRQSCANLEGQRDADNALAACRGWPEA